MPVNFLNTTSSSHRRIRYVSRALGVAAAILAVVGRDDAHASISGRWSRERAETLGSKHLEAADSYRPSADPSADRPDSGRELLDRRPPARRPAVLHRQAARRLARLVDRIQRAEIIITVGRDDRLADAGREVGRPDTASRSSPTTPTQPPPGPKRFTTTLKYLRAWRGQFTYEDHEAPWSVVAPNIDSTSATCRSTTARPPSAAARWRFSTTCRCGRRCAQLRHRRRPDPPDRIEFDTDGAKTRGDRRRRRPRTGRSRPTTSSRACSFRGCASCSSRTRTWELAGEGDFTGTFHLFKGGHDLAGHVHERRRSASTTTGFRSCTARCTGRRPARGDQRRRASSTAATRASPSRSAARRRESGRRPGSRRTTRTSTWRRSPTSRAARDCASPARASRRRELLEWPLGRSPSTAASGAIWSSRRRPASQPMTASLAAAPEPRRAPIARSHEWGPFAPAAAAAPSADRRRADLSLRSRAGRLRGRAGSRPSAPHVTFAGVDRVGRRVAHPVSRDQRRLAGKRSGAGRHHDRLRRADEPGDVRRPRRVRRRA